MPNITLTLTQTQNDSIAYAASDVTEFLQNYAEHRAIIAGDKIIALLVEHCNANDVQLAVGRDAQIAQAYSLNVVQTAAARNSGGASQ